jgi:nucleotide-binding universal stress UspA family protein
MSQLKKILVAYDGSPHSKAALNWGIDLSLLSGAEVLAVKVFDVKELSEVGVSGGQEFLAAYDASKKFDQDLISEVVEVGQKRGVKVKGAILQGNVAKGIIAYAKQNNFDLIIAGTKGHGLIDELLMGSVTTKLISLAHVPVLVVKD